MFFNYHKRHYFFNYILFLFLCINIFCNPSPSVLKMGAHFWIGYEPIFLSENNGSLKKNYIHLIEYTSASKSMRAFRNGTVDLIAITLDEALYLKQFIDQVKVIHIADYSNGADCLLARPGIQSIADLKGKVIGVENTALGAFFLSRILELHSIQLKDIKILSMEINEHEFFYKKKKVDALITYEPVKSKLLKEGAVELFNSSSIPYEIVDVLVVRDDLSYEQRKRVVASLREWEIQRKKIIHLDPETIQAIQKRDNLSEQQVKSSLFAIVFPSSKEVLHSFKDKSFTGKIEKLYYHMKQNKLLSKSINLQSILDPGYLEESLK